MTRDDGRAAYLEALAEKRAEEREDERDPLGWMADRDADRMERWRDTLWG